MLDGALQERSEHLAAQVDALARAVREGGVPDVAASRLLEAASTAVFHALTLELLLAPEPVVVPAVEPEPAVETEVPLAA
jgi:hypothetical protein